MYPITPPNLAEIVHLKLILKRDVSREIVDLVVESISLTVYGEGRWKDWKGTIDT